MKNTEKKLKNITNFNSPLGVGGLSLSPFRGLGGKFRGLGGLFLFLFFFLSISTFAQTTQTITFPEIPVKGYGDATVILNATASSGLAVTYVSSNIAVATVSGNTVTIKTTGYSVISAYQVGNGTYAAATPVPQLLVICPKSTLTVTAADKTINAGATTPAFTYAITGYKKSETASVITGVPAFQPLATALSVGSYPIVINQGTLTATNYEFQMTDGTLTVNSGTATPVVNAEDSIIKIFPNPATNFINIENIENESISIYDLMGNMVLNAKSVDISVRLDVSNLAVGTYIVKTNKNNALITKKLLILR